ALHADEIREVEVLEDVELLVAERLLLRVNLDAARSVLEVHELALAHVAMRGNAPGNFDVVAFLQFARDIFRSRLAAADLRRELVRERIDALRVELREVRPALFDE